MAVLFAFSPVCANQDVASSRRENLYAVALFSSIAEMEKSWGQIDDSNGGEQVRTDYHNMLAVEDPEITSKLPTELGNYRVSYLDSNQQIVRYKKWENHTRSSRSIPFRTKGR